MSSGETHLEKSFFYKICLYFRVLAFSAILLRVGDLSWHSGHGGGAVAILVQGNDGGQRRPACLFFEVRSSLGRKTLRTLTFVRSIFVL